MAGFFATVSLLSLVTGGQLDGSPEASLCYASQSLFSAGACEDWAAKNQHVPKTYAHALHRAIDLRDTLKDDAGALADARKLIAAHLGNAPDYWLRGLDTFAQKGDNAALPDFKMAHDLQEANGHVAGDFNEWIASDYAATLLNLNREAEAMRAAEASLKIRPHAAGLLRVRGWVKYNRGDYQSALADLDEALGQFRHYGNWWYERGKIKDKLNQDEGAVADFAEASRLEPKDDVYLLAYADALGNVGKTDEAIKNYQAVVDLKPTADHYGALAEGLINAEKYGDAEAAVNQALRADPQSSYAYIVKGRLALEREDNVAADIALRKAIALDPQADLARYYLARNLDAQNKSAEALALFRQVEKIWPNDGSVQDHIGTVLTDMERYPEALVALDKAVSMSPSSINAKLDRALVHLRLEHWQSAIEDASRVINEKPDHMLAYVRRAYGYWKQGDETAAKADYDKAVALNPKSRLALEERGDFLRLTGHLGDAGKDAEASLALGDPTADTYVLLGQVAEAQERYDVAETNYDKSIQVDPENPWLIENRAWARLYQHRWMAAQDDCDLFAKRLQQRPEPYYCRGQVQTGLEQWDRAVPEYSKALQLRKDYWPAVFARGKAQLYLERDEPAIKDFTAVIGADYRKAEAYYYRASALVDQGEKAKAAADFEQALRLADASWAGEVAARLRELQTGQTPFGRDTLPEPPQLHGRGNRSAQ